jgi:hypothetical protein
MWIVTCCAERGQRGRWGNLSDRQNKWMPPCQAWTVQYMQHCWGHWTQHEGIWWPVLSLQMMHTISGSGIGHLCLSPDHAGVLAGALDGSVCVFDFKVAAGSTAGCVTAPVAQVPGPISSMYFTAGMASLMVGTQHGDIFRCVGNLMRGVPCDVAYLILWTSMPSQQRHTGVLDLALRLVGGGLFSGSAVLQHSRVLEKTCAYQPPHQAVCHACMSSLSCSTACSTLDARGTLMHAPHAGTKHHCGLWTKTAREALTAQPVSGTLVLPRRLVSCSVQLGARPSVQPLMQSQQGRLTDLSWDLKAPGSIVTASDDGSVCVWDAQVLIQTCTTLAYKAST